MSSAVCTSTCPTTRSLGGSTPWQDERGRLVGRCLAGGYQLLECIGHGAYGSVYRAEQLSLHRDVAVKVLDCTVSLASELAERFAREACAVSRVRHPNTVTVLDFGRSQDGLLYLVMDYVPGVTLTQLIARTGPLPIPRVISLIAQVAMAIEAIHAAGVVHADLKSDNVMREPLARGEHITVVDFGIARLLDAAELATGVQDERAGEPGPDVLPLPTHVRGTPGYMAPEVIRGAAPTRAADVYAAGVLLYFLLTGRLPFQGHHSRQILRRQLHAPLIPPSILRADVPNSLDAVVLNSIARDPARRYADATELRSAIESVALEVAPGALAYCMCPEAGCQACRHPVSARLCPQISSEATTGLC